jgi:hypothetical protein
MREINTVPEGLIGLLDMASRGQSPRSLEDTVRVNVDATRLYLLNRRVRIPGVTANITAYGFSPDASTGNRLRVPLGQAWFVHYYSARSSSGLPAGTTGLQMIPAFAFEGYTLGSQATALGDPQTTFAATNFATVHARDFWLRSGDWLGVAAQGGTIGGAFAMELHAWVTVLST